MNKHRRLGPAAVEVIAGQVTPKVTVYNPIDVDHGYDAESEVL